jgi:hypothetical protein
MRLNGVKLKAGDVITATFPKYGTAIAEVLLSRESGVILKWLRNDWTTDCVGTPDDREYNGELLEKYHLDETSEVKRLLEEYQA